MRLGLFGGSFDPFHYGHLRPVEAAASVLRLDRVLYLPTAQPPHKPEQRFAPALMRYAMVELGLLDRPELRVSGLELLRQPPCYTIDTLRHFQERMPAAELHLLIGADSYAELHTWHEWRELSRLAVLVVMRRPGYSEPLRELNPARPLQDAMDLGRVREVANEGVPWSSRQIRRLIARNEELEDECMPQRVLDFIRKYALYR